MLTLPKYESYQTTGEDWLEEIPEHWQLLRTKNIFRLVCEPAPENNSEELLSVYSDIGVKPRRELEERGNKASTTDGYWFVKKGDVVVNKLLAWMGAIGVSDYDGVTSPAYDILRAYKPIDSKFYHYLFRNPICISKLKQHSKGIMEMRLRLYFDEFGNIKIPYPPLEDQKRIVEFLDCKTSEIDQAIAQKQRLIELLQEQKAILINQAVTKGLNSDIPMRDSGIEWIGEIPSHWETMMIKRIARSGHKTFVDGDWIEAPYITDEGIRLIQTGNIGIGEYIEKGYRYISEPTFSKLNCTEILPNDVLICRLDGPVGRACLAPNLGVRMITSVDNAILKPSEEFDSRFIVHSMSSDSWLGWIKALCRVGGGFRFRISRSMLGELGIPAPPLQEQREIADRLDKKLNEVSILANELLRGIEALNEYRQILIANAVTGKIKV